MEIKCLRSDQFSNTLKILMNSYDEYYWAVAWGTKNKASDELLKNRRKIKKLIIGTHFYQTDPDILRHFQDTKYTKVIPPHTTGTFHPKVYLFTKQGKSALIVGSANFTNGAMDKNHEAMLLVKTNTSDPIIKSLKNEINAYWRMGEKISKNFVDNYYINHRITAKHRNELAKKRAKSKPKAQSWKAKLREWTWHQYIKYLETYSHGTINQRLELLRRARRIFLSIDSFSELSYDDQKSIAGFISEKRERELGEFIGWGWFGSMTGHGDFKGLIRNNNRYISRALDCIPLTGQIEKNQYDSFINSYSRAFKDAYKKGGVPTASRLLSMKRPDVFVCVNKENKRGLSQALGFAHSRLSFETYWYEIIEPIMESIWWRENRPSGQDMALWDVRTAMLDAIYYEY